MKIKIKIRKTSAETVASIDDLLSQILLCLPLKSLASFKLVSKHWHSLITNPPFSLLRPSPAVGLFLHQSLDVHRSVSSIRYEHKFEYFSFSNNKHFPQNPELNFTADPAAIAIVQSSNGLLLCRSHLNLATFMACYIYNPTTKKFLKLPNLEVRFPQVQGMNLAFDPTKSPHYRVVCVFRETNTYKFAVYSSKTRCWRECAEAFTAYEVIFKKGVFWNRAIHWISFKSGESLYLNLDDDDDDGDEMPRKLTMPQISNGRDWRFHYYFGESCGHLHYIEFFEVKIQFDVYEMKRDYSEWFVKFRVDLSPVVASYPVIYMDDYVPTIWYPYGYSIFTLVRGVEEEDSFLVLHIPGEVVRYNLVNGTFETIYEFEDTEVDVERGSLRYADTNGYQYIESLSCVDPDPLLF